METQNGRAFCRPVLSKLLGGDRVEVTLADSRTTTVSVGKDGERSRIDRWPHGAKLSRTEIGVILKYAELAATDELIHVNRDRLNRAVQEISKRWGLTGAKGLHENRLKAGPVHRAIDVMNGFRVQGVAWHSALVHAVAAQKGLGPSRKCLSRSAIGLYGWWTRQDRRKQGLPFSYWGGKAKVGGRIERTERANGQLAFIA